MKKIINFNTITGKIRVLIALLVFFELALVVVALNKSNALLGQIKILTSLEIPAMAHSAQGDMMHDGLRAVVLEAFYYDATQQASKIPELVKETNEKSQEFLKEYEALSQLELSAKTVAQIKLLMPSIQEYGKLATQATSYISAGKKSESLKVQTAFLNKFVELEKSLGDLGEMIKADTAVHDESGKLIIYAIVGVSIFGILMSLLVSFWIANSISQELQVKIDDVSNCAVKTNELSEALNAEAMKITETSEEQAAAIQESSSSLSEIASMISQTNQNAKLSYDSSERILEKTAEGLQTMKHLSQSMETIQKSNIQLQEISRMINDINSKTSVINDIVFKTQLLSFNASIEAARAGQHGRGFAVVAEEVGNLAEMSGHAAREIESLIEDSQRKVKETLEVIQNRVKDGNQVSQLAYQNFEEISHQVKEINLQIKYISEATQQQELGIEQTNIAIKQMDAASEANNQSSRNAFNTSEELNKQGEALTQVVGHLTTMVGRKFEKLSKAQKFPSSAGVSDSSQPLAKPESLNLLMDRLVNTPSMPAKQQKMSDQKDKKFKRVG